MSTSDYRHHLHLRTDGREEVDDTFVGDDLYGCLRDDWCILRRDHDGDCNEDRESVAFEPEHAAN